MPDADETQAVELMREHLSLYLQVASIIHPRSQVHELLTRQRIALSVWNLVRVHPAYLHLECVDRLLIERHACRHRSPGRVPHVPVVHHQARLVRGDWVLEELQRPARERPIATGCGLRPAPQAPVLNELHHCVERRVVVGQDLVVQQQRPALLDALAQHERRDRRRHHPREGIHRLRLRDECLVLTAVIAEGPDRRFHDALARRRWELQPSRPAV